jgi:hypothetical protein
MPDILDAEKFAERFTFYDLGDVLTELPLREMTPVEVLRAWHWYSHEADRICRETPQNTRPSDAEIATVEKAERLWELLLAAMPDWPDGMSVGAAAHRYWPGGRPAN